MKKWILLSALMGAMPLSMLAQDDDMYFVPTKQTVAQAKAHYSVSPRTYYSGSNRSVDEYNRRGSYYQPIPGDSLSDVIDFSAVAGVYPDSTADFDLTRRLQRWDGYDASAAYDKGYADGRRDSWHSPWYYSYYPWYDSWSWYYDPWYYTSWGWYDPWYYGYYWGSPYYYRGWYGSYYYPVFYYGGGGYAGASTDRSYGRTHTSGAQGINHGRSTTYSAGTFGSSRNGNFGGTRSTSSINTRVSTGTRTRTASTSSGGSTYSNSSGNFGGSGSPANFGGGSSSRSVSSGGGGGSYSGGGGGHSSGGGGSRSGGGSFGSGRR